MKREAQMVATYSIPDLQSIIHAVLTRNSRAMCDKHEERLVSIVYLVCLVCLVKQNQLNEQNKPVITLSMLTG
jgi:hypothetical protein